MIPKSSYIYYFEPEAGKALDSLKTETGFSLLSNEAKEQLKETILIRIHNVTFAYIRHLLAEELKEVNPLASYDHSLITKEERKKYIPVILEKLRTGEIALPSRMTDAIQRILSDFVSFSKSMLFYLSEFRKEICDRLFDGREYKMITGIRSSGDTHNHGKCSSVIETDAGRFVYKPHSCQIDVTAYEFMDLFFRDIIIMPKAFAYEDEFGVVEFLEKKVSEGHEEAKRYYRAMGGTTAVIKMLGTTDMHCENLFACGGRLALIDIETLLYPYTYSNDNIYHILYGRKNAEELNHSVMYTSLFNGRVEMADFEKDFSILSNTDEDGSAPVVDGIRRSVLDYKKDFFKGFSEWYDRCLEMRDDIRTFVSDRMSDHMLRYIVWATRSYDGIIKRLNSANAYLSEENYRKKLDRVPETLKRSKLRHFPEIEKKEISAIMDNEIPFFYTYAKSRDLYSDGEMVVRDYFSKSASERALAIIDTMSEREKQFEMHYMKLVMGLTRIKAENAPPGIKPAKTAITTDEAVSEAEHIMDRIYEDAMRFESEDLSWLYFEPGRDNPELMSYGLYTGLAGMAVFFAGMADAGRDERTRAKAQEGLDSCLRILLRFLEAENMPELVKDPKRFIMGEGTGAAGLLHAFMVIDYICPGRCSGHIRRLTELLAGIDASLYKDTDKAGGIAGIVSVLCRFEKLYSDPCIRELIRSLAERLVSLKTLETGTGTVWKTLNDKEFPISGAVHGMTGIAEALYLAGMRLEIHEFESAARDALSFDDENYSEKEEDWIDLRFPGSHKTAKGNCYGAEGIGIICDRLKEEGIRSDCLSRMLERADRSVRNHPMLSLDHLCCGNMSAVDYYLETGDTESAGKLLSAVVDNQKKTGNYRLGLVGYQMNNNVTLFYGLAGIGYELLRYTDPGHFPTVL